MVRDKKFGGKPEGGICMGVRKQSCGWRGRWAGKREKRNRLTGAGERIRQ